MKTIIALTIAALFTACVDNTEEHDTYGSAGSDSGTGNSVQQVCGLTPPAPSITWETTTDTNGNQIVIIDAASFAAYNAWATKSMENWSLCALNDVM